MVQACSELREALAKVYSSTKTAFLKSIFWVLFFKWWWLGFIFMVVVGFFSLVVAGFFYFILIFMAVADDLSVREMERKRELRRERKRW